MEMCVSSPKRDTFCGTAYLHSLGENSPPNKVHLCCKDCCITGPPHSWQTMPPCCASSALYSSGVLCLIIHLQINHVMLSLQLVKAIKLFWFLIYIHLCSDSLKGYMLYIVIYIVMYDFHAEISPYLDRWTYIKICYCIAV